MATVSAENVYK